LITSSIKLSNALRLLELWNRSSPFDQIGEHVLREKIWEDPDFDEDLALVVCKDNEPIAMAVGIAREMVIEHRGYIKLLAVAPDVRRQGIARQLVQTLEDKLRGFGVAAIRVGETAPNYLFPGIDDRYTEAIHLFESLGYVNVGQAHNLRSKLTGKDFSSVEIEADLASKGIEIRRGTVEDMEVIDELIAKYWLAWRAEIATALANDPISIHLAIKEKQVVGFSVYDSNNLGTGWFGPMGTRPEFQGLGIGKALMLRCLHDIQTQGHPSAIIAWVSPTRLYEKHAGSVLDRTFHRYEKRFTPLPAT